MSGKNFASGFANDNTYVGEMTVEKSLLFKNGQKRETHPVISNKTIKTPSTKSRPTTKQYYRDLDA